MINTEDFFENKYKILKQKINLGFKKQFELNLVDEEVDF